MSEDKKQEKVIEFPQGQKLKLKPVAVEDESNVIIDKLVSLVQIAYADGRDAGYADGQILTYEKLNLVHSIERKPGIVKWSDEVVKDLVCLAFKPAEVVEPVKVG
jgi:hypothetical protein